VKKNWERKKKKKNERENPVNTSHYILPSVNTALLESTLLVVLCE
jgi:hypothetical protein